MYRVCGVINFFVKIKREEYGGNVFKVLWLFGRVRFCYSFFFFKFFIGRIVVVDVVGVW